MTVTGIPAGAPSWDVPLNQALNDLQGQITGLSSTVASNKTWLNVTDYGAKGDAATDDKAAIQAAIDACPRGGIVYLPPKQFALSSKLTLPPYVTVQGSLADRDGAGDGAACLLPKAGFTDPTVIDLVDQATGGYATVNRDASLVNLTIDGRLLTTESVQGIRATGFVHGVQLRNVSVHKVTGHGINLVTGASGNPYSWYLENVQISGSGSVTTWDGFHFIGTDHQLVNCRALGVRGHGFYLSGGANTQLLGCRSEWSALSGYYITGSWGSIQGSGGLLMSSCSTDRNSNYGILIDATGNAPINISGFTARRDGRNGFPGTGGGSYAALRGTAATTPIIVTGMTCYPGVGDDGTGVNSPERGVSFVNCTYVSVESSYLHADLTPFHDGGGNTALYRGVAVGTATGSTSAPTRSLTGGGNLPGTLTLTQGGYTAVRGLATNTLLDGRQTGDANARYNVTAGGTESWGSGSAAADTVAGRAASGVWYTSKTALVGSSTPLGDNGVGTLQVADATTPPTTSPSGGSTIWSQSAAAVPLRIKDLSGNVRGLLPARRDVTTAETNSTTAQQASSFLSIPVEASATYQVSGFLIIQSPSGVSFVHSFTGPTGATMTWGDMTATYISSLTGTDTWSGSGANKAIQFSGTLVTSTTTGNLVVTFASGTAGQTATLGAGSWLRLDRVK